MTPVKPEAVLLLKHISILKINQINYASITAISYTQFLVYVFPGVIYFSCLSLANIKGSVSGSFERKGHCSSTVELTPKPRPKPNIAF